MGYTPNLNDKNSPYYYGVDATYTPPSRRKPQQQRRPAAPSPLLADDPELKGYDLRRNPAATAQPPGSSGSVVRFGGTEYNLGDPKQKAAYEKAQEAELKRQRERSPMADIRGGDGLKADGSGRHSAPPRQNPNGVEQKGTQMGPGPMTMEDANRLLTGGYTIQNPFTSNALPATSASAYADKNPDIRFDRELPENMFIQEGDLKLSRNAFDAGSGVEYGQNLVQMPASGKIEYEQTAGAPLTVTSGALQVTKTNEEAQKPEINKIPPRPRGERAGEMWDRQYGRMQQQSEPTETKGSGIDYARRAAFLDAPNSLQGLRRVEAQKGIVYAGGQHNMVNPNAGQEGQNDFIRISKEDRDGYMRGDQGAQDLKAKYVDKITGSAGSLTDTNNTYETPATSAPTSKIDTSNTTDISYKEAPAGYGDDIELKSGFDKKKNLFNM